MLKLYTNPSFLIEKHRKSVFPLLFDLHFLSNETLLEYYILVDTVQECDIVVFPIDYVQFLKHKTAFSKLNEAAKRNDKPIWVYTAGDFGFTNYIKNSYTFRLGGFDNLLNESTFIMPVFINDPYTTALEEGFASLKKNEQPSIGFVGHAQSGALKYLKEALNHFKYQVKRNLKRLLADSQAFYPSSIKRAQYLSKLKKSKHLKIDFVLRTNYRAGIINEDEKQKTAQEFYNNIFNNAYTFCSRGVGNFSVRFYETLAVGRIPVLLNTACRLPLSTIIDWTKHCLILDEKKEESIEEQILRFHKSKTDEEFEVLQINNRKLWKSHLRRPHYFINIHNLFFKENNNNV